MAIPEIADQAVRRARWDCRGTPDQVGVVRRRLREHLGTDHPCLEPAILCASETCTNAISHTASGSADPEGGRFAVDVEWTGDWVKVSVHDAGGSCAPHVVRPAACDERGRGLHIVECVATAWGAGPSPSGRGRVVWFVIRAGRRDIARLARP
ncbi:MAG TPA: ATP-binding protein [Streptosporangiaceae bacterium]